MSESKEMTCPECGKKWIPELGITHAIDGIILCPQCFGQYKMKVRDPEPIDTNHANDVCRFGQRENTCAFLSLGPSFVCIKCTELEDLIRQRLQNNNMTAQGDYCSGPPAFKIFTEEVLK